MSDTFIRNVKIIKVKFTYNIYINISCIVRTAQKIIRNLVSW